MSENPPSALPTEAETTLTRQFEAVWALGAHFVVAWQLTRDGIDLVHLPCHRLSEALIKLPGLLADARLITARDRLEDLISAGCAHTHVAWPDAPNADPMAAAPDIETILKRFTVTHSQCRAVALLDIVNYSLSSTVDQIAQLSFLRYCLNLAASHAASKGFPLDLRTSTTGDGFYAWNRIEGFLADQALYFVTALALAINGAARASDRASRGLPHLRCCIGFGSHFEYFQSGGNDRDDQEFIVGDVTIDLARLIAMALPDQVLVQSYRRQLGADDAKLQSALGARAIDTATFIALTQGLAGKVGGLALPGGGALIQINGHLTGEAVTPREYTVRKYVVTDKHGIDHRCFNLKLDAHDTTERIVHVGLSGKALGQFKAQHLENEDIRIRVA